MTPRLDMWRPLLTMNGPLNGPLCTTRRLLIIYYVGELRVSLHHVRCSLFSGHIQPLNNLAKLRCRQSVYSA